MLMRDAEGRKKEASIMLDLTVPEDVPRWWFPVPSCGPVSGPVACALTCLPLPPASGHQHTDCHCSPLGEREGEGIDDATGKGNTQGVVPLCLIKAINTLSHGAL